MINQATVWMRIHQKVVFPIQLFRSKSAVLFISSNPWYTVYAITHESGFQSAKKLYTILYSRVEWFWKKCITFYGALKCCRPQFQNIMSYCCLFTCRRASGHKIDCYPKMSKIKLYLTFLKVAPEAKCLLLLDRKKCVRLKIEKSAKSLHHTVQTEYKYDGFSCTI